MDIDRQPLACARCFRRKQKCDRQKPQCSLCSRAGEVCLPRGASESDTRSPTSVIEYMKHRISQLESSLLDDQRPALTSTGSIQTASPNLASPESSHSRRGTLQAPKDPVDNALGQIGLLSLNAMGHSASSARGIADRVACSSLVIEAIGLSPLTTVPSAFTDYRLTRPSSAALFLKTPVDLDYSALGQLEVIERFFACAGLYVSSIPDFDCFDMFATWQIAESNGTTAALLEAQPELILMVKLMLAIGLCIDSKRDSTDLLVSALTQDLAQTIVQLQDDAFLSVLVLLIVLSMYCSSGGSTWSLIALAMTRAISLGLHREDLQSLHADSEGRLGVFWTVYILDRTLANAKDRPFALADSDTTFQLESLPSQAETGSEASPFQSLRSCMTHHAQLISQMRYGPSEDGWFHLMNYHHWRDTYQNSIFTNPGDALRSLRRSMVYKQGLQLQSRALVQLATMLIHDSSDCTTQLRHDVAAAVPVYVEHLAQLAERYHVSLTVVDGYEVFAAALIFIPSCLPGDSGEQQQNAGTRLSLDNMKVVVGAMDLLVRISKRFAEMLSLRDVVWAFMTAFESSHSLRSQRSSALGDSVASTLVALTMVFNKADIPRNLRDYMEACIRG